MNLGAREARGTHLLLMNDDIEVITPDWVEAMLEQSQREAVGAVGCKLLFPNGLLQHAGVAILNGAPGHPFYLANGDGMGYYCNTQVIRNVLAVTGACLMTRKEVFHAVGGFDEAFPLNYNDVDLCLKIVSSGKRIVFTPYAKLYHHESVSKAGTFQEELERFQLKWGNKIARDPYYNPNLSSGYWDYRIDVRPAAPDATPEC